MANLNRDALKKLRSEREKLLKDGKPEDIERAFEQMNRDVHEDVQQEEEYNPFREDEFKTFDPASSGKK